MKFFNYNKGIINTSLKIAIPSIVESFFVAFAGLVDSYMVSSLGPNAVAAVGLTTQPKFIGLALFIAINVSVSALVARRYGQKDQKAANSLLVTALMLVTLLSLLTSVLFAVFASNIVKICGSQSDTHDLAVTYLQIIMGGMIFNCLQMCINSAQRGVGNTKITMRTNLTSNAVNIILNYALIGGNLGFPALGIRGAAIATVLGTVVSCIMSIISIMDTKYFVSIPYIIKEKIKPTVNSVKNIISVGYSVFFEQILLRIGFASTAIMAAYQGTGPMAAHQVAMNIMGLSFSFGDGLQAASVALIGKSLGEKNPDSAKEYGRTCQMIGGLISVALSVIYLISSKPLMKAFFPNDVEIVKIGIGIMYIIIFIVLLQIRQVIYMGALRGAGDTLYTAVVSAVSVAFVRTVFSFLFCYTLGFGIYGIWFGALADQIVRYICSAVRFKKGKWVNIKI